MPSVGITAFGAYVPPLRVDRAEIAATHAWVAPGLRSGATGSRSTAGWDEDAITMAVAAGRDGLPDPDRSQIRSVLLATTTAPFADRLNSGLVAAALGLDDDVSAADVTGSLRAGTSALVAAADRAVARDEQVLCVAADRRLAPMGSAQELATGHAAAAIAVGPGDGAARIRGTASLTTDFVDHFRATGRDFDYGWEDRWIREEGYGVLVPRLVADVLSTAGVKASEIAHFVLPAPGRVAGTVAKKAGLPAESVRDQLRDGCGETGAAHPLLMLVDALEDAAPGDLVLVCAFAQGGDALLLEVTDAIGDARATGGGVRKWLGRGTTCEYPRYQVINRLLDVDRGIRGELDKSTALTAAYRHRDLTLGLVGGACTTCGTRQIPRTRACVGPGCGAIDTQVPTRFAETGGHVASLTADRLVYSPDPPAHYGMVDFVGGGRLLMEFTNVHDTIEVGTPMSMQFRIKDLDPRRGFARYFWKAAPQPQEA